MPLFLAQTAVSQGQVELESLRTGGSSLPSPHGVLGSCRLNRHIDLRGSWGCIEHFAHFVFQIAKVKGLLEQANAGIQSAVVSNYIFGVAGHVKDFHVGANF